MLANWSASNVAPPSTRPRRRLFDEGHRDRLATRIAGVLGQARKEVQLRQVGHFFRADEDYGRRVAKKLGLKVEEAMAQGAATT